MRLMFDNWDDLRLIEWDEEYYIIFEYDNKKFSTPRGKGFAFKSSVVDEVTRLCEKGAKHIQVGVRKWN